MLQVEQSLALMESLWEPCDSLKSTVVQKNYFDWNFIIIYYKINNSLCNNTQTNN